jgi:transposase
MGSRTVDPFGWARRQQAPRRALLLHAFYDIRSERQLMEQLHYNLLYRWFVGLGVDDPVWVPTRVLTQFCFDDKPLRFSVMTLPV